LTSDNNKTTFKKPVHDPLNITEIIEFAIKEAFKYAHVLPKIPDY